MTDMRYSGRRIFLRRLAAMTAMAYTGLAVAGAAIVLPGTQRTMQRKSVAPKPFREYKTSMKSDGQKARTALNELLAMIERMPDTKEQVEGNKLYYDTLYREFDQKATQLSNILSTVLKSMNEMQSSTTRNAL